jgi:predicted CopG family antitoxin
VLIKVRRDVYDRLRELKEEGSLPTFSDVIEELLKRRETAGSVETGARSGELSSEVVTVLRVLEYVRRIYSEKLGEDLTLDEAAALLLLRIIHCETGRDPTKELRRGRTWQELVEEFESELMKMLPKPLRDAFTNAR